MPLSALDERAAIVGTSGSGKTWTVDRLSRGTSLGMGVLDPEFRVRSLCPWAPSADAGSATALRGTSYGVTP